MSGAWRCEGVACVLALDRERLTSEAAGAFDRWLEDNFGERVTENRGLRYSVPRYNVDRGKVAALEASVLCDTHLCLTPVVQQVVSISKTMRLKRKALTALAIAVITKDEASIRAYARRSREAGVTTPVLIGFLSVTLVAHGCPGRKWVLMAFEGFDHRAAERVLCHANAKTDNRVPA